MNDLKDFDFFSDYSYTYCFRHLEEDGWSRQEWKQSINLYKNKFKALEIIKEKGISVWALVISNNVETYNNIRNSYTINACGFVKQLTKQEFDLLKVTLCI